MSLAEDVKPEAQKNPLEQKIDELLRRVSVLEQAMLEKDARITELKSQIVEMQKQGLAQQQQIPQQPGVPDPRDPRFQQQQGMVLQLTPEQLREFNKRLDDHFRNFLEDNDTPAAEDPFQGLGPRNSPRPQVPAPQQARKPRLGVSLRDVNRELAAYFKNNVDSGAFVASVVPKSSADLAGLVEGDCIQSFDGQQVRTASDLIDLVRDAEAGKHTMLVRRRGEKMNFSITLGAPEPAPRAPNFKEEDGWLRKRGEVGVGEAGTVTGNAREVVEVRTSALQISKELAEKLSLTDVQRKKMDDVLARHSRKLNAIYAEKTKNGRSLQEAEVQDLINGEVWQSEDELKGVLSDDQLAAWKEYRRTHNQFSISRQLQRNTRAGEEGTNF
jgi:C-terminal processing protease CtpA/Prc